MIDDAYKERVKGESYGFLETHYYFYDNSHTMNAFVKNRCDRALLAIIEESSKELGLQNSLTVEVVPLSEGSLVEWVEFILSPTGAITTAGASAAILSFFIDTMGLIRSRKPPSVPETALDIESKNLDIEKKKLEIKLLQKRLADTQESEQANKEDNIEEFDADIDDLKEVAYEVLINNYKIRKNISVFYENLIEYPKVEAVGYTTYDKNHEVVTSEVKVDRSEFDDFIFDLTEFEEIDDNAKIHIFSPNLDKGRHKWRGLYEKENKVIEFSLNDKEFKNNVESGTIIFKNGSMIKAELAIKIKIDMSGNETSRSYTVNEVISKSDGQGFIAAPQKNRNKVNKKDMKSQMPLPFDE